METDGRTDTTDRITSVADALGITFTSSSHQGGVLSSHHLHSVVHSVLCPSVCLAHAVLLINRVVDSSRPVIGESGLQSSHNDQLTTRTTVLSTTTTISRQPAHSPVTRIPTTTHVIIIIIIIICHSLSLASVKSRLVLPFWYRLTVGGVAQW